MLRFLSLIFKAIVVLGFTTLAIVFFSFKHYKGSLEGYIFFTELALLFLFLIVTFKLFIGWWNFKTRRPKTIAHECGHAIVVENLLPGWLEEVEVIDNYFKAIFKPNLGTITYKIPNKTLDPVTAMKLMAGYVAGIVAENFDNSGLTKNNSELAKIFLGYGENDIDKANFLSLVDYLSPQYKEKDLDNYLTQAFEEATRILSEHNEEFTLLKEKVSQGSPKVTRAELMEIFTDKV